MLYYIGHEASFISEAPFPSVCVLPESLLPLQLVMSLKTGSLSGSAASENTHLFLHHGILTSPENRFRILVSMYR